MAEVPANAELVSKIQGLIGGLMIVSSQIQQGRRDDALDNWRRSIPAAVAEIEMGLSGEPPRQVSEALRRQGILRQPDRKPAWMTQTQWDELQD